MTRVAFGGPGKAWLASAVFVLMGYSAGASAELTATFNAYAWGEDVLKYENSNVVVNPNGGLTPFVHRFDFNNDLVPNSAASPDADNLSDACAANPGHMTKWSGQMQFGLYHTDTGLTEPNGWQRTENWRIVYCDRDGDNDFDVKDRDPLDNAIALESVCPVPPGGTPHSLSVSSEGFCQYAATGVDESTPPPPANLNIDTSIRLVAKDVVVATGCGGNCENEIVTTLDISLDKDCDGDLDPDVQTDNQGNPLMCFFARAEKPTVSTWTGNNQTRITIGGGDKTVNFNFDVTQATVSSFDAFVNGGGVRLDWETSSQMGTFGFHLLRQDADTGEFVQVNDELLLAEAYAPRGAVYQFKDSGAAPGLEYTYKLVEVEFSGRTVEYGPFTVSAVQPAASTSSESDTGTPGFGRKAKGMQARSEKRYRGASEARRDDQKKLSGSGANELNAGSLAASQEAAARVKIYVVEEGLYFVGADKIAAAFGTSESAVNRMIAKGELALSSAGQSVAWLPDNNGIYFFGERIDSQSTDRNVYWLEQSPGATMQQVDDKKPAPSLGSALTFVSTMAYEEDMVAQPFIFDDPDADFWLWDYVYALPSGPGAGPAGGEFTFNTPAVDPAGQARLTVNLKGAVDRVPGPEHHAHVFVNGTEVGEGVWDGTSATSIVAAFDASLLNDGDNILKLQAELEAGDVSSFYLQDFTLAYSRFYRAEQNALKMNDGGNSTVTVDGFNSRDIAVFDISEPRNPRYFSNKSSKIENSGAGFSVSFPADPDTEYLAVSEDAALSPDLIELDSPSNLRTVSNAVNYIIIAPSAMTEGARELVDYRSTSYNTQLVALEDIYDEFSYGVVDPYAIKDFIAFADDNWSSDLQFVVLAGRGTQDHKNRLGYDSSVIPLLYTATPFGIYAADRRFEAPGVTVGRIPALSSGELSDYVDKVVDYEASSGEAWTGKALLLADNPDRIGDFHANSDAIADLLPSSIQATRIHHASSDSSAATHQSVVDAINSGVGWFNYIGHGGSSRLADEGFLTIPGDLASLTNSSQTPIFSALTCAVGNGTFPGFDSLAEEMVLKSDGGFVAAFAPTGLSWNNLAHTMNLALVDSIYNATQPVTLGQAVRTTLDSLDDSEFQSVMYNIYHIIGDPALKPHQ